MNKYFFFHSKLLIVALLICAAGMPSRFSASAASQHIYSFTPAAATKFVYDPANIVLMEKGATRTGNNATWYNSEWPYRQKLVIDGSKVQGVNENFPLLVSISNTDNHLFGKTEEDARDLVFTTGDGTEQLKHEIEEYDPNGSLVAWVKVPKLEQNQNTVLYLYYGNTQAPEQQKTAEVWDDSFFMVQHLQGKPSNNTGYYRDSTTRNTDAIPKNFGGTSTSTTDTTGRIAAGIVLDGTNDYLEVDTNALSAETFDDFTISAWYKSADDEASDDEYIFTYQGSAQITFGPTDDLGGDKLRLHNGYPHVGTSDIVDQQWHHVVAVRANGRVKLYVDGALDADLEDENTGTIGPFDTGPWIGDDPGNTEQIHGSLDEIRLIKSAHSASWISTEYNNQSNPDAFFASITQESKESIEPIAAHAIAFSKLSSFKETSTMEEADSITYQLSNDGGDAWHYWNGISQVWEETTQQDVHSNTADVVNKHISSFPVGKGQFLFRAYLPSSEESQTYLQSLTITFAAPAQHHNSLAPRLTPIMTLSDPLIVSINSLFRTVYNREITYAEWVYWAGRVLRGEKTTFSELFGALQYSNLIGN